MKKTQRFLLCVLTTDVADFKQTLEHLAFDWIYILPGDDLVEKIGTQEVSAFVHIPGQNVEPAYTWLRKLPRMIRRLWYEKDVRTVAGLHEMFAVLSSVPTKQLVVSQNSGVDIWRLPNTLPKATIVSPVCFLQLLLTEKQEHAQIWIASDALQSHEVQYFMHAIWPMISMTCLSRFFCLVPTMDDYRGLCDEWDRTQTFPSTYAYIDGKQTELPKLVLPPRYNMDGDEL